MQKHIRHVILAGAVTAAAAAAVPIAGRGLAAQQVVRCYFKDCLVFADGSRLCTVKEVPCEKET